MERFDRYWIGILLGLLMPVVFILVYIDNFNMWYIFSQLGWGMHPVLGKILLLSAFPDLAVVFVFYSLDAWKLSKGLLLSVFPFLIASAFCSL